LPGDFEDVRTDPHAAIPAGTRIAPHGEKTGDELLADVLAEPASDDLRMVYADYLLERGDPRGELIALQLARHRERGAVTARERELLAAHTATWTQPLYNGLAHDSIRFARGFLAGCRTIGSLALRDSVGHPLWATVEQLDSDEIGLVVNPCMRSVRTLRTRLDAALRLVEARHEVRVEELDLSRTPYAGIDDRPFWEGDWRVLLRVGALVRLRTLVLGIGFEEVGPFAPVLASPLGHQLTRLGLVTRGPYPLARWCAVVQEHATLDAVSCHSYGSGSTVTLERERVVLALDEHLGESILHTLQSFGGSTIRQLVISYPHDADRAGLDAIVRRMASVFPEIVPQARYSDARGG